MDLVLFEGIVWRDNSRSDFVQGLDKAYIAMKKIPYDVIKKEKCNKKKFLNVYRHQKFPLNHKKNNLNKSKMFKTLNNLIPFWESSWQYRLCQGLLN